MAARSAHLAFLRYEYALDFQTNPDEARGGFSCHSLSIVCWDRVG
jgi:hypothetical protein